MFDFLFSFVFLILEITSEIWIHNAFVSLNIPEMHLSLSKVSSDSSLTGFGILSENAENVK